MCDLRGMFQVTRNSDKLHVAILLLVEVALEKRP